MNGLSVITNISFGIFNVSLSECAWGPPKIEPVWAPVMGNSLRETETSLPL